MLSTGPLPEKETTTVTATASLPRVTALRLDLLTDDSLPQKGPGRAENGNLHLNEFEVHMLRAGASDGEPLKIRRATADRRSLDDVLRLLYRRHLDDGYAPEDVRAAASEVAGRDLSELGVSARDLAVESLPSSVTKIPLMSTSSLASAQSA